MSVFVVPEEHVIYLVQTAVCMDTDGIPGFEYYYKGKVTTLTIDDHAKLAQTANMLWRENVKSWNYQYGETINLSEYCIDPCKFSRHPKPIEMVQVLKSCNYYIYQACEHPEWKSSKANTFISELKEHAIRRLPGYEEAVWGVPGEEH